MRKAQGKNSSKISTENSHEKLSELLKSAADSNDSQTSILSEALNLQVTEESNPKVRPPILINHGLLSSSADFVLLGPQKALGKY